MTVQATVPAQSISVPSDPALVAMAAQVAAIQKQLAALQAQVADLESSPNNTFPNKINQPFSQAAPYNEHRWLDETGKVRGEILTHGWDSSNPQQYHGHMSFYVWDTSDPSGNNRHHPLNIYYGTRYASDPASDPRFRSRIAWDHSYFDLMDSVLVMGDTEVYILNGKLATRPKTTLPAPTPAT